MTRRHFLRRLAATGALLRAAPVRLRGSGTAAGRGRIESTPLAIASASRRGTMFEELAPDATGLTAENRFRDPLPGDRHDPRVWTDRLHEFSVGALGTGVAVGDYDNDGRPDLFVVSKTESCRLYRNLGNWRFADVTAAAGVGDAGDDARVWKQGATFVDLNNRGRLDLYVCRFNAPNRLYINQGDGTFREEAAPRGLAVTDASVMAAFCDYDRDGFLDVFLQTNLLDPVKHPNGQRDYLFHNNGDGTFTNVTERAGLFGEAQGHSAIWWDYDGDGWPDLYVANDFAQPDQLYHNNRDGTFTEVIDQVVPHMPYSSMGSDCADVDGDGRIDLLVADMAATVREKDQRTMAVARSGYRDPPDGSSAAPQVPRNALYLNTGAGRMREGACLAGLAATDWTWAARFEDFDNDGRVDLLVTNGMHHEVTNVDLIRRVDLAATAVERTQLERGAPVLRERHLAFRNEGDLTFTEVAREWGFDRHGVAFGLAVGDFGGTGNLDVVYSNFREPLTFLRNRATGHRIVVELRGVVSNRGGVGATVRIETAEGTQVRTLVLARGVLSSSEPVLHFGLGKQARVARLLISWPSGHEQVFADLPADHRYVVTEPDGPPPHAAPVLATRTLFEEVGRSLGLAVARREPEVDEFADQPLLPWRFNRCGPAPAIGRLSAGGPDVVVIGGTAHDPAQLFRRSAAGVFEVDGRIALGDGRPVNDGPVLFFDADGDGRNDLLITKGGSSLPAGASEYQPRLFLNDGAGGFRSAAEAALPPLPLSAGAVAVADFDRDGRLELFVGARLLPGQYPAIPSSALLANRGGRFEDITDAVAPGLRHVGMVTAALWTDVDGDGWVDLLVALEWGPIKYFHNDRGRGLEDWTERAGFSNAGNGWWSSLAAADVDGDGRMDYIAGNAGLNTAYQASAESPALLLAGDFEGDGNVLLIEAEWSNGRLYPRRSRNELGQVMPSVLRHFRRNDDYARAALDDIIAPEKLEAAQKLSATELRSGVFRNQGDGTFRFQPLPRMAQIAPFQGTVALDLDGDGNVDIAVMQNSFAPAPPTGRFDGGIGQILGGDGRGGFVPVPVPTSGFLAPGDGRGLAVLSLDDTGSPSLMATRNQAPALVFRSRPNVGTRSLRVTLNGRGGNPDAIGAKVVLICADGRRQTVEVSAGGNQSSAACFFGYGERDPPARLRVRWPSGAETEHRVSAGACLLTLTESR